MQNSWKKYCCCSVTKSCPILCNPINYSMPVFPVLHHLPEFAQTHVHRVSDVIQTFHTLLSPSPSAFNLSHHQGLFWWVGSLYQVAKVLQSYLIKLRNKPSSWRQIYLLSGCTFRKYSWTIICAPLEFISHFILSNLLKWKANVFMGTCVLS